MYFKLASFSEQEQIIRALRGWQFDRDRHGSLYDRGSCDSYYQRGVNPHYGGVGGGSGPCVLVSDTDSVKEYMAGYNDNEALDNKKDWR